MEEDFSWEDDLMTKSYKRQESHLAKYNFCFKKFDYLLIRASFDDKPESIINYTTTGQNLV